MAPVEQIRRGPPRHLVGSDDKRIARGRVQDLQPGNSYFLRGLGISIEPPAIEDPGEGNLTVASFFLPPAEGFSGNVNVMRQAYAGTIKEYSERCNVLSVISI